MDIFKIHGVIKDYAWGSRDYLPSLFSYTTTGAPQAEAWFGTHSAGEAMAENGEKLSTIISSDSAKYLGPKHDKLPLLLKVLAIQKPLSVQCHPDKVQAVAGWLGETEYRKDHDRAEWLYKDPNEKTELYYALTPSTIMCGFRPFDAVKAHFTELFPTSYKKYLAKAKSNEDLFKTIFTLEKAKLNDLLKEYITSLENSDEEFSKGQFLTEKGIALSSYKEFSEDPALICPYLLNVVHLRVGEALYVAARTLHSCVLGNGIELSSSSDNVMRCGLTHKKVDIPLLIETMNTTPGGEEKIELLKDKFSRSDVKTPNSDFNLLAYSSGMYEIREQNAGIVLVTEGIARFSYGGEHIVLEKGEAAFIPYCVDEYTLKLRGKMFFARIPS